MMRNVNTLPFGPERMRKLTDAANDLMLLAEVIDAGGFSAASVRTGVSKSRLSRRISELEALLGVALLLRNSRHFEVTEIGQQLYQHGRYIRSEMNAAVAAVHDNQAEPHGSLRIASPIALTSMIVGRVAAEFARANPRVRVSLSTTKGTAESLTELFDLVLLPSAQSLPNSDMIAQRLALSPYVLVAAPAVVNAADNPVNPAALQGMDAIGWGSLDETSRWHFIGPNDQHADVEVRIRFSSDNLTVIREAALAGLGIARLPLALCREDIERSTLCVIAPGWAPPPMSIYALYASRRHISAAGKLFLSTLAEAINI
ncbi:LysR substrate-binding domain-containing protein [Undibacterium arcticum]|uniref:LysR substrate-binding domain-containing protein n=2 Tax=Undibacterium arcticum TaxID=1762892 RepID=A0ABV7EVS7_9BURK